MSSTFGQGLKLSIFGESHGPLIGVVIDNLPAGIKLDKEFIDCQMQRRRPGQGELSSKRDEDDKAEIVSGVFNQYTTGAPLCAIIKNTDTRSRDYSKVKDLLRPSHSDYSAYVKYRGFADYRGGGHFSGRLTAPFVFAGALCKQILAAKNVIISSHILKVMDVLDREFNLCEVDDALLKKLQGLSFPVIDPAAEAKMRDVILAAQKAGDSVGAVIECCIANLGAGVGDPFFDGLEGVISSLVFSVPGVKGIEFGAGFKITDMLGSQANDEFYIDYDANIKTKTNNSGGISGGISNAMPIIFRTAIKPTPSIYKQQDTINILTRKNETLKIQGRHDPCIASRAAVVIESAAAVAVLDRMLYISKDQFED